MSKSIPSEIEEWRPVIGYEGVYSVSSFGRVRRDMAGQGTRAGIIRKPYINPQTGYLVVTLGHLGIKRTFATHQLVAESFLGPCPSGHIVHHKDEDHTNARLSNLEYATQAQNLWVARYAPGATSKYRGVYLDRSRGLWMTRLKVAGKVHWIGRFTDEVEAARAHDEAARRLRGKYARLNFPKEGELAA
jgi:hypothetical protein